MVLRGMGVCGLLAVWPNLASAAPELPAIATGRVTVTNGAMAVSFRPEGATAAPRGSTTTGARYAGAIGGADLEYRHVDGGVEDLVHFRTRPAREELVYDVDVVGVAGLRLVADVLELVDRDGAPRLRVRAPTVEDAAGVHDAKLEVRGCAVDRSAAPPWGRPVVAPGASSCEVVVTWGGVTYPATVDPAWVPTSAMVYPRYLHAATLLDDGRVLVAGGYAGVTATAYTQRAEVFDPATGTWAATATMTRPRARQAAMRLPSGEVLEALGDDRQQPTGEAWDPTTGTWHDVARATTPRDLFGWTVLSDGRLLVAGGCARYNGSTCLETPSSGELYDPGTDSWAPTGNDMRSPRSLFSLVPIADGRVVAAGGCRGFDASFGCAGNTTFTDYYDPVADLWTEGPPLPIGVDGYAAAPLGDGALVVGGYGQSTFQFATYVLDPAADAWISVGVTGYEHLLSPIAVLPTGELLLTGSWGTAYSLSDITDTAEVFDPVSETWSTLPSMRASRGAHTATVLDDGRVLLASGLGELGSTQVLNATGELWDPSCADVDADGLCDDADACLAGDDRIDDDGDGTPEACDNCPGLDNPDQTDSDGDGIGDACDPCPSAGDALDSDGDGVCDSEDACADFDDAFDDDHDGLPNQCDSCPQDVDPGQEDEDGDGVGDACDPCPTAEAPDDADGDGVCDLVDAGGGGGGGGATQGCGGCDTGSAGPGWLLLALPLALRRRR